jgi:pimeloyl-ACP methyl ester carboxylesterase
MNRQITLPPYRFWETRIGAGTPIVLIHGLGGSSDWWRHNVPVLAESHTVAAVDLVGFGRNRRFLRHSSLPLRFPEIAALLARWIESSFASPVHLVGNSLGGHVAIHLAAQRPDLVRSLTLVDSTGIPFAVNPRLHLESLAVPRGWNTFVQVLARDLFRGGPTGVALARGRLLRDDARPLLRTLTMPVLLVWGESDPLVPLTYAEQIHAEVPQARLEVIPRAGHIPMWENPAVFNGKLLEFLSEVDLEQVHGDQRPAFSWGIAGWNDGIAHREAGRRRDIVLLHGLGMSSRYFDRFARSLFDRGWNPIAPDLPGFGKSDNAPAADPEEHARTLARWAETLGIRDAVWVGHSSGCNIAAHLARLRPDLVRASVWIGALWTGSRHPWPHFALRLTTDAFREPFALYGYLLPAYWRAGLLRWWQTFRRDLAEVTGELHRPETLLVLAGERDPIPDLQCLPATLVPGAHACFFSNPDAAAEAVSAFGRAAT